MSEFFADTFSNHKQDVLDLHIQLVRSIISPVHRTGYRWYRNIRQSARTGTGTGPGTGTGTGTGTGRSDGL